MKLKVEINQKFVRANDTIQIGSGSVMFSPPLDGEYWRVRVKVSRNQAVIGFPKFGTIGVGFQHEEDYNTNLPYSCCPLKLFDHIKRNRRKADRKTCIEAISLITKAVFDFKLLGEDNDYGRDRDHLNEDIAKTAGKKMTKERLLARLKLMPAHVERNYSSFGLRGQVTGLLADVYSCDKSFDYKWVAEKIMHIMGSFSDARFDERIAGSVGWADKSQGALLEKTAVATMFQELYEIIRDEPGDAIPSGS